MISGQRFQIFGLVDLSEPLEKSQGVKPVDPYMVKMRILNATPDASGETPDLPHMDFSELDKNGSIKYEHDPFVTTITKSGNVSIASFPTAKNNIGGVLARENTSDGKGVNIIGRLFPQMEETKHVLDLMKSYKEWNELYPHKKRTMQCSVEGQYLTKSKDGRYTAKVANVAITPQAQDEKTWVQQASAANLEIAKSMNAGAATTIADKTDGAALIHESLEGSENSKNHKEKKMKKFMSRTDARFFHMQKGLKGADLDAAVAKEFADDDKVKSDSATSMQKSQTNATDAVALAVSTLKDFGTKLTAQAEDNIRFDTSLKKSMGALAKGETVDGAAFMATSASSVIAASENNILNSQALAKSLEAVVGVLGALAEMQKSQASMIALIDERTELTAERLSSVAYGLRKSMSGIVVSALESHEVAHVDAAADPDAILKSINAKQAENFLADRAVTEELTGDKVLAKSYWAAAKGLKLDGINALSMTMRAELVKKFTPASN